MYVIENKRQSMAERVGFEIQRHIDSNGILIQWNLLKKKDANNSEDAKNAVTKYV